MSKVPVEDFEIRFHQMLVNFSLKVPNDQQNFTDYKAPSNQRPSSSIHPLERYLCVNSVERIHAFFKSACVGDVILGKVANVTAGVPSVTLQCVLYGNRKWIRDLKITALTESHHKSVKLEDEEVEGGDHVKAIIVSINAERREIVISFNNSLLTPDRISHFPLGKVDCDEFSDLFATQRLYNDNECDYDDNKLLLKHLLRSPSFNDPHSTAQLLKQLQVDFEKSTFLPHIRKKTFSEGVEYIRDKQSFNWSMDMVGTGVKHFRGKELKEAMMCFNQAIKFYPKNVEAFVARGALKANEGQLNEALEDFKQALSLNKQHKNGTKYYIETLFTVAKNYEKQLKWRDASKCYRDILEKDDGNTVAKERQRQLNQIMSREIVSGRVSSESKKRGMLSLSRKSQAQIDRLKKLLEADANHSTTDTESSTSSTSDSSSGESGAWVEKPAANKKRNSRSPTRCRKRKNSRP